MFTCVRIRIHKIYIDTNVICKEQMSHTDNQLQWNIQGHKMGINKDHIRSKQSLQQPTFTHSKSPEEDAKSETKVYEIRKI